MSLKHFATMLCATAVAGCTYGGLAVSPDGKTLYVARNGLFNLGRRIYQCSLNNFGETAECRALEEVP